MILFLLAYLGGVLTILSPCILPVLPFVFARADRPFLRSGLPMLIGMAATFAAVASLAAVGGGWAVEANQWGRFAAMALLALFGVTLLMPSLAEHATRPLVALGARLSESAESSGGIAPSLLLGVATGLLWAPCAGPILGLILTGAALQGASVETSLLLVTYAAGAATSLALALLIGGRVFTMMKRSLGVGDWVRRGLGAAVLAAVVVVGFGLDTGVLTQVTLASTSQLEQGLLDRFHAGPDAADETAATGTGSVDHSSNIIMPDEGGSMMAANPAMMAGNPAMMAGKPPQAGNGAMMAGNPAMMAGNNAMMAGNPAMMAAKPHGAPAAETLKNEGMLPALDGAVKWVNSPPLTADALKGKVVLVDFWTYSCINCLRALPYVEAWAQKYKDQGLVVIGVHAPEFAFEKNIGNVEKAVSDLGITYPVAIDNDYALWRSFKNQFWPAHYFIDAQGKIRHHHFGEGDYDGSERVIQQLLAEAGTASAPAGLVAVKAGGAEAAPDLKDVQSPETYIGYDRAENFISPGGDEARDKAFTYAVGTPRLNEWGVWGDWTIGSEHAMLNAQDGGITYRFHARDLHLVLGPAAEGKPVRFQVTIDGAAPGDAHGADIDDAGDGVVTAQRLYQLVRQGGPVADHTFSIRFLDPGVEAYAFTFG